MKMRSYLDKSRPGTRIAAVLVAVLVCISAGSAAPSSGAGHPAVEHPFRNPRNYTEHKRCDNCGMDRNKWARTRHEFTTATGSFHTCSIACVALLSLKRKEETRNVRVTEYLHPEKMLDANKASYVVGSSAPGTMSAISKIAFENEKEAAAFVLKYGGSVFNLKDALAAAKKEVSGGM